MFKVAETSPDSSRELRLTILTVQVEPEEQHLRIAAGYGAQECVTVLLVRKRYRSSIESKVERAKLAGYLVIVAEDVITKLRPWIIKDDPHHMSENGKLLHDMIKRQELEIKHSIKCSVGPIKRKRKVSGRIEESCIDLLLVQPELARNLYEAIIESDQFDQFLSF